MNGALADDYEEMDVADWIHTGHYLFNAHISGSLRRGYPVGKVVTIAGDPKTGKSYLIYNGLRNAQKKGYFVHLYETENAPDRERFIKQGLNLKQMRIPNQPETVSDIIINFTRLTETLLAMKKAGKPLPKIAIAIDSLSVLNSQKQFDDALKGDTKQDRGSIAKDINQLFNMMTVRCGKLGILWLNTAHLYEKEMGTGGMSYKVRTPSGGNGAIYMSSVVPILSKKYLKDAETKIKHGVLVTSQIFESRYAQHHNVDMYINFEKGMNEFLGLQEYVSWDVCGIDKGKVTDFVDLGYEVVTARKLATYDTIVGYSMDDTFFSKLAKPKQEFLKFSIEKMVEDGYLIEHPAKNKLGKAWEFTKKILERFEKKDDVLKYKFKTGDEQIAVPNPGSNTWAIKHLGKAISVQELFTEEVFTPEVIEQLDIKVIMPKFKLSDYKDGTGMNESVAAEASKEEIDVVVEVNAGEEVE